MAEHRILSFEEAATHTEGDRGPWQWSAPVHAIISDSWKWKNVREPWEFFVAESAIENLYRCGYVVAEVLCVQCSHAANQHRTRGCDAEGCDCGLTHTEAMETDNAG